MLKHIWTIISIYLKKIWKFLTSKRDYMYILIIILISLSLMYQCNRNSSLNTEVQKLENNILALNDTLTQYQDENGRIIAEKHAFILTEKELRDSINLIKTKNREYLTYINTQIGIKDTIEVPTYIERPIEPDTTNYIDEGVIKFDKYDLFGKSSRELHVQIPYTINDRLNTGNAGVDLYQNIFVESMLERDKSTGETFVRLMTDYPNAVFNSGLGVLVTNSKSYEKSIRKSKGIGIGIGPSVGIGYDLTNKKIVPTIGVSVTIGFTWTPKWTQW